MDSESVLLVFGGFVGLLLPLAALGTIVLTRDTLRRQGRWGINFLPLACPDCGTPAPVVRSPRNLRQALWGGCTCADCGTEYDKWGEPVERVSREAFQET